jgi:hypothetical protein
MYSYLTKDRMDEEVLRNLLACHPLDPDPAQDGPMVYAVHEGVDRVVADVHRTGQHPVSGHGPGCYPSPVKTATSSGVSNSRSAAPSVTRLKKPNPSGLGR